ncbi:MAG: type III polyketide synthase [Cryomorphaceae bacterium]|nr:type III polyketide synthase [Cryomorphaceae bacterium]
MMSYISQIETAVPDYSLSPEEFTKWALPYFSLPDSPRKMRFLARSSGIEKKYTAIPDFVSDHKNATLYSHTNYEMPSTAERMKPFLPLATELGQKAAEKIFQKNTVRTDEITHIIAVSCTGLVAPGLEIELCKRLNLSESIQRSAVNFMGCYAAFHALKQAHYICGALPNSKVLIVAVELCSLHFRNCNSSDNLLSSILFSDGAAAVLVTGEKPTSPTLQSIDFSSALIREGEKDMAWEIGDTGFQMQLKNQIPEHIKNNIRGVFTALLKKNQISPIDIKAYAIHPGGKNILKGFVEALDCKENDLAESFDTLRDYGNMSSVSVLFVMKKILENPRKSGSVYGAAFGPGLTVESGLFLKSNP